MCRLIVTIMLITYFLCGCGGDGPGGAEPVPRLKTALLNPSDRLIPLGGYDFHLAQSEDTNMVTSVAWQATQPGTIIAYGGRTNVTGFGQWTAFLAEVAKYPAMTHAYVYDELGWKGGVYDLSDQTAALAASTQARAQGLKTVVTYMPEVVLNPAFSLGVTNGFDIIAIDIYPNVNVSYSVPNAYPGNRYSNLLKATYDKLRALGFTGEVWYIYQAFDVLGNDPVWFHDQLVLQRATIDASLAMGITGIVPFGMYLGAPAQAREPWLIPLEDTQPLVIP